MISYNFKYVLPNYVFLADSYAPQVQTQALFRRAVTELVSGVRPRDEHALEVDSNPLSFLRYQQLKNIADPDCLPKRCTQQEIHQSQCRCDRGARRS